MSLSRVLLLSTLFGCSGLALAAANTTELRQTGDANDGRVTQNGDRLSASITQEATRSAAWIEQQGADNQAVLYQMNRDSLAVIRQEGALNTAQISQQGSLDFDGNLSQVGNGNSATLEQTGGPSGEYVSAGLIQIGNDNQLTVTQRGSSAINVSQDGDRNVQTLSVSGRRNNISNASRGNDNRIDISQDGELLSAGAQQIGDNNLVTIEQTGLGVWTPAGPDGILYPAAYVYQNGNANQVALTQRDANTAFLTQNGNGNSMTVNQR